LGGNTPAAVLGRIRVVDDLADAVQAASHIQENAPENLELKTLLFRQLDVLASPDTVIASSTSALLPSAFTQELPGRGRCIVAHPVNPPHLIPLVELVPAPWTTAETLARTEGLMHQIGQSPVRLEHEIDGFLLNRIQAAVLDEAFRLVDSGLASAGAVDACLRDGLALRWVFMGPFETIDLNAPQGVRDYVDRYQPMFRRMTETMRVSADWSGPALDRIEADRRARLPREELRERQMWRDRQLMALATFRRHSLQA
ncbi:MAG TPA: 3-hydroxyacyl-CoA dehydrogenase, partial [Paracoccus sp. (in: a-proteobacteria)]|uniref:3-hydroxyacyl-CoA dehydrogenase n=1 Tax=Paracoccus sp. TaxID=267 RepID=UPI002C89409A